MAGFILFSIIVGMGGYGHRAIARFAFAVGTIAIMASCGKKPEVISAPVPLGTNELKIGAKLYNPHRGTNEFFTVIDINPAYDFPDEDTRPGVKIRSETIGGSSWVPRETLNNCLVVQ